MSINLAEEQGGPADEPFKPPEPRASGRKRNEPEDVADINDLGF